MSASTQQNARNLLRQEQEEARQTARWETLPTEVTIYQGFVYDAETNVRLGTLAEPDSDAGLEGAGGLSERVRGGSEEEEQPGSPGTRMFEQMLGQLSEDCADWARKFDAQKARADALQRSADIVEQAMQDAIDAEVDKVEADTGLPIDAPVGVWFDAEHECLHYSVYGMSRRDRDAVFDFFDKEPWCHMSRTTCDGSCCEFCRGKQSFQDHIAKYHNQPAPAEDQDTGLGLSDRVRGGGILQEIHDQEEEGEMPLELEREIMKFEQEEEAKVQALRDEFSGLPEDEDRRLEIQSELEKMGAPVHPDNEVDRCPVCQDVMTLMDMDPLPQCGHRIHTKCLIQLMKAGGDKCPTCQEYLDPTFNHAVALSSEEEEEEVVEEEVERSAVVRQATPFLDRLASDEETRELWFQFLDIDDRGHVEAEVEGYLSAGETMQEALRCESMTRALADGRHNVFEAWLGLSMGPEDQDTGLGLSDRVRGGSEEEVAERVEFEGVEMIASDGRIVGQDATWEDAARLERYLLMTFEATDLQRELLRRLRRHLHRDLQRVEGQD